ncbi:hypothetical protein PF005_g22906 [Phytophthora fragariae]|uniref:C2 domain-containing protein n=1 Tax=Phytophthora fragariae TaxID=53985 RepID=A0A6A3XMW2_9STRA|nr:hypothetical protein PF003_g11979 [Phytophthora fragariae]KAE8928131.1 hypothetical protein PF009_g21717 [Phytophthora fragariae]KAE9080323.1 hypothetical protein PF007_g23095 [Phytophthora fragariae]KAE9080959.1 hypothetical protein PF010_g22189 [Phytophthora fragariae]KAE9103424.1 hypothetical protein PF006_g22187 [Phytophthora fragariae]
MLLKQRQVLDQHSTLRSVADLPSSDFSVACCKSDLYVSLKLNSTKPRRPCLKNTFNTVRDPPEHYIFPVWDATSAALSVEVHELDALNPDDLVYICIYARSARGQVGGQDGHVDTRVGGTRHEWAAVNELCEVVG